MALDGIFLRQLCRELGSLTDTRIEKIYQPSRDELVLLLRSVGFSGRLLISAKSGFSRISLSAESIDNPAEPPAFCKLMRKYIGGAKLTEINQLGLDRTVIIGLSCYNEMGDNIHPFLAVELFSNRSNIILCEENGRIIDAIHRSDIESSARLIQPGAKYVPLEPMRKPDPYTASAEVLADGVLAQNKALGSAFMNAIDGVSPLISRELASRCSLDPDSLPVPENKAIIISVLEEFKEIISDSHRPTLVKIEGEVKDFSYMPITQYGSSAECVPLSSYNSLLEEFYCERDKAARLRALSQDISRLLNNLKARAERRLATRLSELEQSRNRESLRIYGELLKANLYAVEKGATEALVQNYYDPELKSVKIPLNPALSPTQNAAKYFKDYKKSHTAEQTLTGLIEADKSELQYIDSVLLSLSLAESAKELSEIRDELFEAGYIFRPTGKKRAVPAAAPLKFYDRGFLIMVGKNNRENDTLTLKTASKEDIWLHTKDIPGSHVIIFTDGKEVPEETLIFAARLAARHSKAKDGSRVPVDSTLVKYVKKPSGAKPGMVIYTHARTLFVNP